MLDVPEQLGFAVKWIPSTVKSSGVAAGFSIDQILSIRDSIDVVSEMGHNKNILVSEPGTVSIIIYLKTEPNAIKYDSFTDTRLPSEI